MFHIYSALKSLQENNTTWPLPVKIFCRDEKGERVDVSKYLIKKGLALRERRYRLFKKILTSVCDGCLLVACANLLMCAFKSELHLVCS